MGGDFRSCSAARLTAPSPSPRCTRTRQEGGYGGAWRCTHRCGAGSGREFEEEGGYGGSRDGYRKEGSAPGDYNPEFRGSGGFGRGAGMQR